MTSVTVNDLACKITWNLKRIISSLPRVVDDGVVVRVVLLHLGRGHVEGATPDLDLLKVSQ